MDGDWRFAYEVMQAADDFRKPQAPGWFKEDFVDAAWQRVVVPEWRYRQPSCIAWYRVKFSARPAPAGQRVFLCFGGVDWEAEVWLNGKRLGSHSVYYEPFRFDVTDALKPQNTLAVRVASGAAFGEPYEYWGALPLIQADDQRYVRDPAKSIPGHRKGGDMAYGSGFGIFRDVYLETTSPVYAAEVFVRGDPDQGAAKAAVELDSAGQSPLDVRVQILPENFEGRSYEQVCSYQAPKGSSALKLTVPMPGAELWSPETPRLYRCRVLLQQSGKTVDSKDALFGYRSFGLVSKQHPRAGLQEGTPLLNGKPIYFYGTVDGAFNLNWFWRQEDKIVDALLMLKAANFNAIHPCQHVNFPEVLELYDRLGFMSQQDQGALHNADRKRAFPQLVHTGTVLARQCYNNPGVVLLCFGNETHFEPREVLDAALAVDPERIIVPISGHGNNHLPPGYNLPEEYWANIINDFHAYFGWYPAKATAVGLVEHLPLAAADDRWRVRGRGARFLRDDAPLSALAPARPAAKFRRSLGDRRGAEVRREANRRLPRQAAGEPGRVYRGQPELSGRRARGEHHRLPHLAAGRERVFPVLLHRARAGLLDLFDRQLRLSAEEGVFHHGPAQPTVGAPVSSDRQDGRRLGALGEQQPRPAVRSDHAELEGSERRQDVFRGPMRGGRPARNALLAKTLDMACVPRDTPQLSVSLVLSDRDGRVLSRSQRDVPIIAWRLREKLSRR